MASSTKIIGLMLLAAIVLHETTAFVRIGRGLRKEKALSNDEKQLEDGNDITEENNDNNDIRLAPVSRRIIRQLRQLKRLIGQESNKDIDVYLFIATSHRAANKPKRTGHW
eukprot:gene15885-17485_t